ncbi:lipopolysaccharide biosynthesis protein [Geodermatophilus sp. FMUSA9-8]|uniref:lipopolysaccharide biosynthesis protein n=1 Tax=Geodermatophilus sp. FMUSA9-8 TaxID=3120155 RepID=UPI003009CE11
MTGTSAGLARSASRGAVATLTGQGLRLLVQLAGIAVLARLLSPEDYGLVAIVAVVVTFGELFRDLGLSSAAVQAPVLGRGQRDNLFWLNTALGASLAALLCGLSPLLPVVFGDDRLTGLALALSATFVLNGVSTQYRASHQRALRFGTLTACETGGQVAGVAAGIALAALGAGYWSLVAQQLTQGLVTQVALVATARWVPGWPDRTASIRSFVGYGLPLLGTQVVNHLATNADTLVIGARFGAVPAGLYNRAFSLVSMPLLQVQAPATRVALPVLSRLRDDDRRFRDFLVTGQFVLLTLVGLSFAVLFAQAPAAVAVVLGPTWGEVVPLFRLLLVAGFCQAATYAVGWVFLARGLTRSQLRYALTVKPVTIALVLAGSAWGVQGVAAGYAIGTALTWPVALLWIRRTGPAAAMARNGLEAGALSLVAAGGAWAAALPLPAGAAPARLAAGLAGAAVAAALLGAAWPALRRDLRRAAGLRRHLRGRRTPAPAPAPEPSSVPSSEPSSGPGVTPVPRVEAVP